jgi:tetratricopeptide (TPR) repeat protein
LALGERAVPEGAIPHYALQQYTLLDFRGNAAEVEPEILDLVVGYPARPVFRCALAHLHARLGRFPEAKRALDDLTADRCSPLPFDQEWIFAMSLLAEASALLADVGPAQVLYEMFVPWAAVNAVDQSEGIRGSVSRYLGLLATTLTHWDDAVAHFEDALEMNERMGARPWLAHTQTDYAQMLAARDDPGDRERAKELLDQALATYRELRMVSYAARAAALAQEIGTLLF